MDTTFVIENNKIIITFDNPQVVDMYGGIHFPINENDLRKINVENLDIINVSFLNTCISIPVVHDYNYLDNGQSALALKVYDNAVGFLTNGASFASLFNLYQFYKVDNKMLWKHIDGVTYPIKFEISLKEKRGYFGTYKTYAFLFDARSFNREDYPLLDDASYANFRDAKAGKIKKGILFRSASPIFTKFNRNQYADEAAKKAGVKIFINLSDYEKAVKGSSRYQINGTYYETQDVVYLGLPADFSSQIFTNGIAEAFRYIGKKKQPVCFHCVEGKDRTGVVIAILQALMGSSAQEIIDDYFLSYQNFFKIEKNSEHSSIFKMKIIELLENTFGTFVKLDNAQTLAEKYLSQIGMSIDEINELKLFLGGIN